MLRIRSLLLIVLMCAFTTGVMPSLAQEGDDGPPRVGLRPDAPAYALHGPYWVGVRDYSVPEGDTHFWVSVWYPALNPDGATESITYNISDERRQALAAVLPLDAEAPIAGHALAHAAPDVEHGPYPLILFSPGLNMWRQSQSYEMEHLASQGFVVMAMEHNGETLDSFWGGAYHRPIETVLAAQYADQLTAVGGDLAGLINPDKLAIIGISSGGWAALVGGGAQMDLSGCSAFLSQAPEAVWTADCNAFSPQQNEIAALFGLSSVPSGLWPQYFDPRVDALVTMDPDGDIWGVDYQGVSSVTIPTMVFGSTGDTSNIPEHASIPIYERLGSNLKSHVVFENAEHGIGGDPCDVQPWLAEIVYPLCSDPVWDKDRAHDLINHLTTAFLLDVLKGDAEAHAALLPDAVSFPGITYETTMR